MICSITKKLLSPEPTILSSCYVDCTMSPRSQCADGHTGSPVKPAREPIRSGQSSGLHGVQASWRRLIEGSAKVASKQKGPGPPIGSTAHKVMFLPRFASFRTFDGSGMFLLINLFMFMEKSHIFSVHAPQQLSGQIGT